MNQKFNIAYICQINEKEKILCTLMWFLAMNEKCPIYKLMCLSKIKFS